MGGLSSVAMVKAFFGSAATSSTEIGELTDIDLQSHPFLNVFLPYAATYEPTFSSA